MANGNDGGRGEARPLARGYLGALERADATSRWVIIALMAVMTATVVLQVVYRYALNSSIDSADEISRLTFVWAILLAIPHGLRTGAHVGIDLLIARLPDHLRARVFRLTSAASILLLVIVAWHAARMAVGSWDQPMPTLPLPTGLFYVGLLISSVHIVLHLLAMAVGWVGEPNTVEPGP